MIFDFPPDIQMAIRLRAIKNQCTTGEVIVAAMEKHFYTDVAEARAALQAGDKK